MRRHFDTRVTRLEGQMQDVVVAHALQQARPGPPETLGERLLDVICAMQTREHQDAILHVLTDAELAAVSGKPDFGRFAETMSDAQLLALAAGDPEAERQVEADYARWRKAQGL